MEDDKREDGMLLADSYVEERDVEKVLQIDVPKLPSEMASSAQA